MVIFKDGVRFKGLTKALLDILDIVYLLDSKRYPWAPENIMVTSVNDGVHALNSRHYKNEAVDIRSRSFKDEDGKVRFAEELSKHLGEKFTVLYEDPMGSNQHFHIQVKKGVVY